MGFFMCLINKLFGFIIRVFLLLILLILIYFINNKKDVSIVNYFKTEISFVLSEKVGELITIDSIKDYYSAGYHYLEINNVELNNNMLFDKAVFKLDLFKFEVVDIVIDNPNIYIDKKENLISLFEKEIETLSFNGDFSVTPNTNIYLKNATIATTVDHLSSKFKNINAHIKVNNGVTINMNGDKNLNAWIYISENGLIGNVFGDFNYIKNIMDTTPLDIYSTYINDDWNITGDVRVALDIPFEENTDYEVLVTFKNNEMLLSEVNDLRINNISGELFIGTKNEHMVYGRLSHTIFNNKAETELYLENDSLYIDSQSKIDIVEVNEWLKIEYLNELSGKTLIDSKIIINDNDISMQLESKTVGLKSKIPYPFSKSKKESSDLNIKIDFSGMDTKIKFNNHNIRFRDLFKKIDIGFNTKLVDSKEKINIYGEIDKLNIDDFINYICRDGNSASSVDVLKDIFIDLKIKDLFIKDNSMKGVILKLKNNNGRDKVFEIISDKVSGKMLILDNGSYIGEFSKLRLFFNSKEVDTFSDLDLDFLRDGKIKIDNFYINDVLLYDLNFDIPKNKKDLEINITSNSDDYFIGARLIYSKKENTTKLIPTDEHLIYGNNIYSLNKWSNKKSPLKTKKFFVDLDLNWKGNPLSFNRNTVSGTTNIEMSELTFKGVGEDYSSMKILNIFNFDNLFRFMMFDFKNISNKEINFDKLKFKTDVELGVLSIADLTIKGDDALVRGSGTIDTVSEVIDAKIKLQVPVVNKMPLLTLLAGASPQTAGIVFLVEKIFGKEIDKAFDVKVALKGKLNDIKVLKN
jgi:uncharacterized protein YhdP